MSNFYRNLENIDDSYSLDRVAWLTEVRKLSLAKLDAEATAESCETILEWAVPALEKIVEEGQKTREELNRLDFDTVYDWDQSREVVDGHLHYLAQKWRHLNELIKVTEEKLQSALDALKDSEEELCEEPIDVPDEWNKIHFLGCIQWAEHVFSRLNYLRKSGKLPADEKMIKIFRKIEKKYYNREVVRTDYLRICGTLALWLEWKNVSSKMLSELKEREANVAPRWKIDLPPEDSSNMSMEAFLDLKREAEALVVKHGISLEDAFDNLLENY